MQCLLWTPLNTYKHTVMEISSCYICGEFNNLIVLEACCLLSKLVPTVLCFVRISAQLTALKE